MSKNKFKLGVWDRITNLRNKLSNKLFKIFYGKKPYKRLVKNLRKNPKGSLFFISAYSTLNSMKQRPEHLFDEFINRGYDVVVFDEHIAKPVKTANNYQLLPLSFFVPLAREISIKKLIMSISTHQTPSNIEKIFSQCIKNGSKVIYEHLDDFDLWKWVPKIEKKLRTRFKNLCLNHNILITTTAEHLYDQAKSLRGSSENICLVKNAVNPNDFSSISKIIPDVMQIIKKKKKPIVGYYGVISDDWFDYKLMDKVISKNKNFEFVFIGPLVGKKCEELRKYSNLTYIPPIPYEKIPQYANLFDIAIIPFQLNDITKSTSPVKMFEYMALQKPIIATPLKECMLYKSCIIAHNANEFSAMLKRAMSLRDDKNYMKIEKDEMDSNTWSNRVDLIEKALGQL